MTAGRVLLHATEIKKRGKKYTSRTVSRHRRRSHMSRAGFTCQCVECVGCVGWVGKWCGCVCVCVYTPTNTIVFWSAGVVYYIYIYYTREWIVRDDNGTASSLLYVVFRVGWGAGGWVRNEKNPPRRRPGGGARKGRGKKNFGAHTLQLLASSLTYCEMRRFFRFSSYFSPSWDDGETVFPRFSPPSSRVNSRKLSYLYYTITTARFRWLRVETWWSRPISVFPIFPEAQKTISLLGMLKVSMITICLWTTLLITLRRVDTAHVFLLKMNLH